jgi:hypothetical protein
LVRTPADKYPELLSACRDSLLRVLSHRQSAKAAWGIFAIVKSASPIM